VTNTQPKHEHPDTDETHDEPGEVPLEDLDAANIALEAALDKKALEPLLLDVRGLCSYANYILVLSGRSDRQVEAISNAVAAEMKKKGNRAIGVEGAESGLWALMDFGDIIVHVFHHPVREHYDLESLWIDAKRVDIDVPPEARISPEDAY
jgi:ribosome-associated protein